MTDPFFSAGPPGTWSRGNVKQSKKPVRFASNSWWNSEPGDMRRNNESEDGGLYDRASAALSFGNDSRLSRLVSRVSKMFKW